MTSTAYLPIEAPPEGWVPQQRTVRGDVGPDAWAAVILGPPVRALPDLSPEARALLEAAARFGRGECDSTMLKHAAHDYAATLPPPDPMAEARKAFSEILSYVGDGPARVNAQRGLAALDRMKKDPAA